MSDLLSRLKQSLRRDYIVTVEIHLDDLLIHQAEVPVQDYNRRRAMKRAMKHVESVATVKAVSVKLLK